MNTDELKVVQGLLEYLDDNFSQIAEICLRPDVQLIDSNGETAARIEYNGQQNRYLLVKVELG